MDDQRLVADMHRFVPDSHSQGKSVKGAIFVTDRKWIGVLQYHQKLTYQPSQTSNCIPKTNGVNRKSSIVWMMNHLQACHASYLSISSPNKVPKDAMELTSWKHCWALICVLCYIASVVVAFKSTDFTR
jgi:hypothetical protein